MSLSEGSEVSPDELAQAWDGVGAGEAAEGAEAASEGSPLVQMLRSSEPQVSPQEIGRQLDVGAEWWQHYGAGFTKMSGSDGTEAWMNFVVGTALLVLSMTDAGEGEGEEAARDSESEGAGADARPEPDGEIRFEGPQ